MNTEESIFLALSASPLYLRHTNGSEFLLDFTMFQQHMEAARTLLAVDNDTAHFAVPDSVATNLPQPYSPLYQTLATLLHGVLLIFGALGNLLVILVVIRKRFLRTPVNFYLVSLAVADVLLLLSSVPETIASYFRPAHVWMLGRIGCRTLIFLQYLGINSSSASLLAFSLERYFAVCRPRLMDYQVNTRKAQRMIAVIWLGTTFYCSPWFWLTETASMGFELQGYEHLERCTFRLSRDQYAYLFVGDLILFYVLPLFVCGWLYAKMGLVLYKSTIPCRDRQEMEVVESPSEMVNLTGRCSIDSDKARKVIRSRIQVVRMLALVVFLFAVLSAPYRGLMVYNCFAAIPWFNKWYLLFAKTSVYLNSAINPVLYNSMNSRFRMAFRSMLSCEKVKK